MIKRLYSIRDQKAEIFGPIIAFLKDGEAIRVLDQTVNSKDNQISRNPEDFRLFYIGEFHEESGIIIQDKVGPKFVADAAQFKIKQV